MSDWHGTMWLGSPAFVEWDADVPEFLWPDTEPCWAKVVNGR